MRAQRTNYECVNNSRSICATPKYLIYLGRQCDRELKNGNVIPVRQIEPNLYAKECYN